VLEPGAIIATNTSYLDVDLLAAGTNSPPDVLGLHFFSPASVMRLLEIVVGAETAPGTVATGLALAGGSARSPIRAEVSDGFIANRMLVAYRKAADEMLEDGASVAEVDAAMRAFGFPLGPYQVADLAGLDISWERRKRLAPTRDPNERYVAIGDRSARRAAMARRTGAWLLRLPAGLNRAVETIPRLPASSRSNASARTSPRARFPPGEIVPALPARHGQRGREASSRRASRSDPRTSTLPWSTASPSRAGREGR
jgi:3-hydroxyacyl-CoA dehydrogenase